MSSRVGFSRSALILLWNQASSTHQLVLGLLGSPNKEFVPMIRILRVCFCLSCLLKLVFRSDALGLMVSMGVLPHVE